MNAEPSRNEPSLAEVYPPHPSAAARVRHGVRATLAEWKIPTDAAEDIVLVVEELVANVIDHAGTPFRVRLDRRDDVVRVTVHDENSSLPELRTTAPTALRGRGLRLIAALGQRWGYEPDGVGKSVWAEIPVSGT